MGIVIKAKSKAGGDLVQNGTYEATLAEVRQFENAYGDRLGFEFALHGEAEGLTVMRSTSVQLSRKSKLAEVIRSLLGREITEAEMQNGVDLETFIGNRYNVLVRQERGKHGHVYSNVELIQAA